MEHMTAEPGELEQLERLGMECLVVAGSNLRKQWADAHLAGRDKAKMGAVYLAGEGDDIDDLA